MTNFFRKHFGRGRNGRARATGLAGASNPPGLPAGAVSQTSDAGGPLASASTRREISEVRREILGKIEQEVRTSHFVPCPSDGVREVRLACLAIGDLFEEGDFARAYELTLHVQQVCKLALLDKRTKVNGEL